MTPEQEHTFLWNDRLQDWLDADIDPADGASFESHLADCDLCQQRLAEFEQLDRSLRSAAPPIALDESFDRRLFAQIETIDDAQRAAARQRVEQELHENLRALSRSWRRTLAFVVPGVVAGIALAFALAGFISTEVTHEIVAGADSLAGSSDMVNVVLTTLLGATIGAGVARWLALVAE
ncbi:MAG: anti-sigma factor family protein [Steroidobacter sp.]